MPSLMKTLRRCHSTVRVDRNSWAPISAFDRPARTSRMGHAARDVVIRLTRDEALVLFELRDYEFPNMQTPKS
jgi:hypothetical protein